MRTKTSKELERGLRHGLKPLQMPGMRMAFQEVADLAQQESMSFECFMLTLVEQEQQSRAQNRIPRALRVSRLPRSKTLKRLIGRGYR